MKELNKNDLYKTNGGNYIIGVGIAFAGSALGVGIINGYFDEKEKHEKKK